MDLRVRSVLEVVSCRGQGGRRFDPQCGPCKQEGVAARLGNIAVAHDKCCRLLKYCHHRADDDVVRERKLLVEGGHDRAVLGNYVAVDQPDGVDLNTNVPLELVQVRVGYAEIGAPAAADSLQDRAVIDFGMVHLDLGATGARLDRAYMHVVEEHLARRRSGDVERPLNGDRVVIANDLRSRGNGEGDTLTNLNIVGQDDAP